MPDPKLDIIDLPRKGDSRYTQENGELHLRFGHDREAVYIDFGQNVSLLKIDPEKALAFAKQIEQQAIQAKIGV